MLLDGLLPHYGVVLTKVFKMSRPPTAAFLPQWRRDIAVVAEVPAWGTIQRRRSKRLATMRLLGDWGKSTLGLHLSASRAAQAVAERGVRATALLASVSGERRGEEHRTRASEERAPIHH
jgi:hypothetical protein